MSHPQDIEERTDWEQMKEEVFALISRLRRKPEKLGYLCSSSGILNAYQEGDLTFDGAIEELEAWSDRRAKDVVETQDDSTQAQVCMVTNGKWYLTFMWHDASEPPGGETIKHAEIPLKAETQDEAIVEARKNVALKEWVKTLYRKMPVPKDCSIIYKIPL